MKRAALILACLASACASTYAANPHDPVDMSAEMGNRGRAYVGMGAVCDQAAGGGHRETIVASVRREQARLGVLADLVNRAYRGAPTTELATHMQTQMARHDVSAAEFCDVVVASADRELHNRATLILAMSVQPDLMGIAREHARPPYGDTPSFDPLDGYLAWVQ